MQNMQKSGFNIKLSKLFVRQLYQSFCKHSWQREVVLIMTALPQSKDGLKEYFMNVKEIIFNFNTLLF